MGYRNHKAHKDGNHTEIVNALRGIGAFVIEAQTLGNGQSDIIAALRPTDAVLLELKVEGGQIAINQLETMAQAKMYGAFVKDAETAIKVVRNPMLYALTEKEKRKLLLIAIQYRQKSKDKNPRISVEKFEALFRGEK